MINSIYMKIGVVLGRALCRLGKHHWVDVRFRFGGWTECYRCEQRKVK